MLRVYIPKSNGGERPLGIPTIRDRTVQVAACLVLEPIFEADFEDCSYGFRPGRHQHHALDRIQAELKAKRTEVYDVDLSSYFDTIDHDRLMEYLRRRISDRSMPKLIGMWLRSPVVEDDGRGGTTLTRPKSGSPQGGSISPLLSNTYLHEMDRAFHEDDGPRHFANARLIRFADDLVVMARWMGPRVTGWLEDQLEGKLGLTINRKKTDIVQMAVEGETLNFLGFTFRYDKDLKGRDWRYLNVFPSKKALSVIRDRVRMLTQKGYKKPFKEVVLEVNNVLHDWAPYYRYGYPRKVFRDLNHFVRCRFRKFLRNRSQRICRPFREGESIYAGLQRYGLVYL